jgi:cytochrome c
MSELTFNKIAGAALATGLAIVGLRELSAGVFAPEHVEKPGYAVEVVEEAAAGGAAVEAPIDWGTVLPTANVAAGETVYAKCVSCHNIAPGGANGTGPNQYGVVGAKPGSHPGFSYSPAMAEFAAKQPVWDYDHLSEFLKAPQKYMPGTKMTFVGIKKAEDRINLIAYLRSQGGKLPIPAPNPAAAAPAEGAAAPAEEGKPTATGSTATPAAVSGGPAGQGAGAPAPGAPAQQKTTPANPHS